MCYIIQIYPTVGSLGQRLTQYTSGLNFLQLDFKKFPTHFDYREISQLDLCKCKSIFFNLKMCCIIQIYPTVGGLGQRFWNERAKNSFNTMSMDSFSTGLHSALGMVSKVVLLKLLLGWKVTTIWIQLVYLQGRSQKAMQPCTRVPHAWSKCRQDGKKHRMKKKQRKFDNKNTK